MRGVWATLRAGGKGEKGGHLVVAEVVGGVTQLAGYAAWEVVVGAEARLTGSDAD